MLEDEAVEDGPGDLLGFGEEAGEGLALEPQLLVESAVLGVEEESCRLSMHLYF